MKTITAALCALLTLTTAGCARDATQLLVLLDSDLEIPKELSRIEVTVLDTNGRSLDSWNFPMSGDTLIPVSFTIDPGRQYEDSEVLIIAEAIDEEGEVQVRREAQVGFIRHQRRFLPIFLPRACRDFPCGGDLTCTERGCSSKIIDAADLTPIAPGTELEHDAGTPFDAGEDGVAPDADIPDAQMTDAVAPDDAGIADIGKPDAGPTNCMESGCADNKTCVNPETGNRCTDITVSRCECRLKCDPFAVAPNQCPPDEVCHWSDERTDNIGACIVDQGGRRHAQSCETEYDPSGRRLSDDCNASANVLCVGTTPEAPNGTCGQLCRRAIGEPDRCRTLGRYTCTAQPPQTIGVCRSAPEMFSDIGTACTRSDECMSEVCDNTLMYCSANCSGLNTCPTGSQCVIIGSSFRCAASCATDFQCQARSPDSVCEALSMQNRKICIPSCVVMPRICAQGTTCNRNTGHCE